MGVQPTANSETKKKIKYKNQIFNWGTNFHHKVIIFMMFTMRVDSSINQHVYSLPYYENVMQNSLNTLKQNQKRTILSPALDNSLIWKTNPLLYVYRVFCVDQKTNFSLSLSSSISLFVCLSHLLSRI